MFRISKHSTEMCSGSEAGSYLRLIDSCTTQLKAQGPSWACNESQEEKDLDARSVLVRVLLGVAVDHLEDLERRAPPGRLAIL